VADLAVIIVSANSARWLRACLTSVFQRTGGIDVDVVVADNASTDGTGELVENEFPQARVVPCANRGFAHGNNRAFMTVSAPFVLFLNPDTEILSGTFAELLACFERSPEIGLIGVRQVTPDGVLFPTIRRFPNALRTLFEALGSEHLPMRASWLGERELDMRLYEREVSCDWTSGSFMLARREALLSAGLMDERFFIFCEEPDLCLRMKKAGWDIRHVPGMTVLHHFNKAGWNSELLAQDAYARRLYMEKHYSPLHRYAGLAALMFGHVLRASLGGRNRGSSSQQRAAAAAALAVLLRRRPPPFGSLAEQAVSLLEPETVHDALPSSTLPVQAE
jgi:GT2 family glycosyltransferase